MTTDDTLALDVNYLNKRGFLRTGTISRPRWTRGGEPAGDIRLEAIEDGVTLVYRMRIYDGDWQRVRETVSIVWQSCFYGGERPYFLCPKCGQRIAKLYGRARFLCRSCNNLSYQCQRETGSDRTLRKDWKLRALLGGEPGMQNPIPDKPKGMHWRTYNRIVDDIYHLECIVDEHTIALVDRLRGYPS